MHVEIDDRDAVQAVLLLRMARGDGDIVENAKAHRPRGLGVMAGRALCTKALSRLADHLIDREHRAAGAAQRRLERAGRHRRVAVEPDQALLRRGFADRVDIILRMAERDGVGIEHRRLFARERGEFLVFQRLLDRAQTVGPLGMAARR